VLLAVATRRRLMRVVVQGESMAPGLRPGDRLLAVKGVPTRVGDIVTAVDPRQPSRVLVKRVVAVDAHDRVMLGGDNAVASTDSRSFGPVPADLVSGRVIWRYWPSHRRGRPSAFDVGPGPSRSARVG
jgi:nickel-type superoxide dismutase maturation protease